MNSQQTYITKAGLEKLGQELNELKTVRRKEIAERISAAQELGDLSENAEYATAKVDQAYVEGRIAELESILKNVIVIEEESGNKNEVSIGSRIKIKEHAVNSTKPVAKEYHIVGSHEADPTVGWISNESPIGKALLGAKKGDQVEIRLPKGTIKCEVIDIN